MLEFLEGIGSASMQAFWMPVLVWTGLAGATALGLGVRDRFGPRPLLVGNRLHPLAGYRLRQALLLALPASVLAAPWVPTLWWWESEFLSPVLSAGIDPAVMPSPRGGVPLPSEPVPTVDIVAVLLGGALAAVVVLAMARVATLCADLQRLRGIRLTAPRVDDSMAQGMLRELGGHLGVRRRVDLLEGPPDSPPMTFGFLRPVVVVPRTVLESPESLRTVLAHELIHVRRGDCFWALLESLTCAGFAFHPLAWLLRRAIDRCRETSCDAEVVAAGLVRPREYAELLAHTHTPTQFPTPAVAASMSARAVTLKERLETMENFADTRLTSRRRVRLVVGSGTLFLLCAAVAAACAGNPSGESAGLEESGSLSLEKSAQSYVIPLSIDPEGPVQYTRITQEEVEEELARLETQVEYLRERMQYFGDREEEAMSVWGDLDDNARRESLREFEDLRLRRDLLRDMRKGAIRRHETVKLAYETQKRMRDRS